MTIRKFENFKIPFQRNSLLYLLSANFHICIFSHFQIDR